MNQPIKYQITLPFPRSVNQIWRVGRPAQKALQSKQPPLLEALRKPRRYVYRDASYVAWIKRSDAAWMAQKAPGRPACIEGKFDIRITLYPSNRQRRDPDNCAKVILDWLVRAELIRDDSLCHSVLTTLDEVRPDTSCCVVELEEYQP